MLLNLEAVSNRAKGEICLWKIIKHPTFPENFWGHIGATVTALKEVWFPLQN